MVLSAPRPVALKIGELARRSGLLIKTIRYSSEEGLIHSIGRSEGGYRQLGCAGDAVVGQVHAVWANVLKGSGGHRRSSAANCPDRMASN